MGSNSSIITFASLLHRDQLITGRNASFRTKWFPLRVYPYLEEFCRLRKKRKPGKVTISCDTNRAIMMKRSCTTCFPPNRAILLADSRLGRQQRYSAPHKFGGIFKLFIFCCFIRPPLDWNPIGAVLKAMQGKGR